jgi:hypothetical protein
MQSLLLAAQREGMPMSKASGKKAIHEIIIEQ